MALQPSSDLLKGNLPMMPVMFRWLAVTLAACSVVLAQSAAVHAAEVRKAVWAGQFYPAEPSQLEQLIDDLARKAQSTAVAIPAAKPLRALVLPHAGYIYSGLTAAHASRVLRPGQFAKVVLMGPDHRIGFSNAAVSDVEAYETPLGRVRLHADARRLREKSTMFQSIEASDRSEHCLEVVLPFLQRFLHDFELVPIVVGPTDVAALTSEIETVLDQDTLLVVSSDLSHFLTYDQAVVQDRETIQSIVNFEPGQLARNNNRACGAVPLLVLMRIAHKFGWEPVVLHYSNSGDTAGDRSRVVGYAAIAFFGEASMENDQTKRQLSEDQGQALVKLARQTIMIKLGRQVPKDEADALAQRLQESCFASRCGTFVTLKIADQLRGCIGNLTASDPLQEGVRRNAIHAAFHDPRFPPLAPEELNRVQIEVSVLTEPQGLSYTDASDLIRKLRPHVDGVIIRKGAASATFLPQVWDQLPSPEDFLSHLCRKAGLPSYEWQNASLEVLTYQVQYFEEHH
jgi:AmmeMemoRadiSam system protein B/AmmeMemoRadiSam system protein A